MENPNVFSLKLHDRMPDELPLDRLADYIKEFAMIIGKENQPVFSSVDEGSVCIRAGVPVHRAPQVSKRLKAAHSGSTEFGLGKRLLHLEEMMADDGISKADFLSPDNAVLATLEAANDDDASFTVSQEAEIDGEVTGVIGADETMHITLREVGGRIVKVVAGIDLGRRLGHHIRSGYVRLHTYGQWNRTDAGWKPDSHKCHVRTFEILKDTKLVEIFTAVGSVPENGWRNEPDALGLWRELRGAEV